MSLDDLSAHEHLVEQRIQQAMREGAFDRIPGGRLPELDEQYEPNWWVKKLIARENLGGELRIPRAGQLRDRLLLIEALPDEDSVRRATQQLNQELAERLAHGGARIPRLDPEVVVERWRRKRAAASG